ncbi:ABC transporter B family member 29, chloroplastic, partial [Tanacetum coccineum]
MFLLIQPSLSPSYQNLKLKSLKTHITNHVHYKPHKNLEKIHPISCTIHPTSSYTSIKPFVESEWKTISTGWLFSAVSVYSLSRIVPCVGKCSAAMSLERLKSEGLVIGVLFLVRLVSSYLQQSLLWEASLRAVYKMRVSVFEKVLKRELGFFEGGKGSSVGDVAYRITAEASDVADTVYAVLN